MLLEYLKELEKSQLPLTVIDPASVRKVALLRGATLITAILRSSTTDSPPHSAIVFEITPQGLALLQHLRK